MPGRYFVDAIDTYNQLTLSKGDYPWQCVCHTISRKPLRTKTKVIRRNCNTSSCTSLPSNPPNFRLVCLYNTYLSQFLEIHLFSLSLSLSLTHTRICIYIYSTDLFSWRTMTNTTWSLIFLDLFIFSASQWKSVSTGNLSLILHFHL